MQTIMNNGKLTQLFPGNGFLLNGHAFVYEKYENGNCIIRDTKKKNSIFVYGYEGLKRTVRQFGYDLMKEVKWMNIVTFNRKWEINTKEDLEKAMEELDGNEFVANMSDEYSRTLAEVAEINKQRADVIRQAKEKGLWKE